MRVGSINSAVRAESEAIYAALAAGVVGAITGLLLGLIGPPLPLGGVGSFGLITTVAAGLVAAAAAGIGYWRVRAMSGQEWRHQLSSRRFTINTTAVVLVHAMMAVTLGLTAYVVYLSVSRMTTQRMSTLLMSLVVIGTLTAMVTSPDEVWWETHFSQLGTFWDISSFVFNGTIVIAGLLVRAFAVYLSNDMQALADSGRLQRPDSPRIVATVISVVLFAAGYVSLTALEIIIFALIFGWIAVFIRFLGATVEPRDGAIATA